MATEHEVDEAVKKLNEYASLEGSETGEMWSGLADLWRHRGGAFSASFEKALVKEILREAKRIDKECEIVEEDVTRTYKSRCLKWR